MTIDRIIFQLCLYHMDILGVKVCENSKRAESKREWLHTSLGLTQSTQVNKYCNTA